MVATIRAGSWYDLNRDPLGWLTAQKGDPSPDWLTAP